MLSDDINLTWNLDGIQTIGYSVNLTIYIQTKRSLQKELENSYLYYKQDEYFLACKEYVKGRQSVTMTLKPHTGASIDTLPSAARVSLLNSKGEELASLGCAWSVVQDQFAGDFFETGNNANQASRNILIFGLAGSTKSSFINSCYSMLGPELTYEMAQSGGSQTRTTTTLKSYKLLNKSTKRLTNYRIWDTWGLERNNYKDCEFEAILQGRCDSGYQMDRKIRLGNWEELPHPQEKNVQHCVIFFIPVSELDGDASSPDSMLRKTMEYMEIATQNKVSCIVALTKMDTLDSNFRKNPFAKSQSVEGAVKKASLIFNIGTNRIFPLVNYFTENKKAFDIDRLIWKILDVAARVADSAALRTNGEKSAEDKELEDLINS